ncbi:MAG: Cys-tRNA(Pro) deacylase [Clostridiales bacterium]|jgi:Cys-tRNA(Pro)/Cys-tRNA(Cys) deacylase|nr:Cys-tRNA(Pro) deacylase [Clostridiales bacterium]MCI2160406.1 Cys-tRNA(Pro) deacylase [Oscillospiraceae bacterium]MCI1961823.1 Cys-tRNA(Pro) deacylase [Clostridiales bacterium]MCI2022444.1 Cys-tRNA(Pro) deacylase [Clostridiales bacterium]MCI2026841.1 Cys-tRNA(Pro) deacylase [Clostridiales bacterium]
MAKKEDKTNVMRILDQKKISYRHYVYENKDGKIDGVAVAKKLGQPIERVFKTLVTKGGKEYYVFVVPVAQELDLKAAARSVGAKSIEMIHVKEINALTGYIRGGCSPIGMKKQFQTVLDESAMSQETIIVSGGRIGTQVELAPSDLVRLIGAKAAPICMKKLEES